MTAETRFERDLTAILKDLYLGPTPDYRSEALAVATRRRQRPSWTFPGRWIPMADIASTQVIASRVPWRALGVALLVIALLIAALATFVGSHVTRPAPPFGVAGNGRIAYVDNGNVFLLEPTSGVTTALAAGPATDDQPVFSPDGSRIAFRRSTKSPGSPAEDIVVANADGSNPIVVTPTAILNGANGVEWAPDSRSLLVGAPTAGEVRLYDATHTAQPRVIARGAFFGASPFRPPDGRTVMLGRPIGASADAREWFQIDVATGKETPLVVAGDPSSPRWSPDGSQVAYVDTVPAGTDTHVLFVVSADGTGARPVTGDPDSWAVTDPVWSPDGTRIAFNRFERVGGSWAVRPTGIVTVATGAVAGVGPLARDVRAANPGPDDASATASESYNLDWSPDGRWLLAEGLDARGHAVLIDTTSGTFGVLAITVPAEGQPGSASHAWQRTAP